MVFKSSHLEKPPAIPINAKFGFAHQLALNWYKTQHEYDVKPQANLGNGMGQFCDAA